MGEIGRDRREFLYQMTYCEIALIVRGYRRRNILQYQLQRLQAYGSFHCMGSKNPKSPDEWLPLYIDRYRDTSQDVEVSQETIDQLQAEMAAMNAQVNPPQ